VCPCAVKVARGRLRVSAPALIADGYDATSAAEATGLALDNVRSMLAYDATRRH